MGDNAWIAVNKAYDLIKSGGATRIEGEFWKVYLVPGQCIRIDISTMAPVDSTMAPVD